MNVVMLIISKLIMIYTNYLIEKASNCKWYILRLYELLQNRIWAWWVYSQYHKVLVIIKKHGIILCDCGSTLEEMHSFSFNLQDMMISDPLGLLKWPVWVDTHSSEKIFLFHDLNYSNLVSVFLFFNYTIDKVALISNTIRLR